MNHSFIKKFAQESRKKLISRIGSRLDYIIKIDDPYLRAHTGEKKQILELIKRKGRESLIEDTAYTWFNRLTALRFMDVKGYNRLRIVSPAQGGTQPQILAEIKKGNIPAEISILKDDIMNYLRGRISSSEPDREVYKIALLAWCNYIGYSMPFLFKPVYDWAGLLLPQDLLSSESIIADICEGITEQDCMNVEIIGWLYQYYISEKKNEVFEGLKKNKKITPENLPAATQLFTPHWIVRYLVENSLGRFWLLNHPRSSLAANMDYYIPPEKPETDYLILSDPEEIKICDPACGSGHMLVYAFDLLYNIYEEEGYSPAEIPAKILKKNLYGIEIDERAGELAAFSLLMKARERDRHFLEKPVQPNIRVLSNIDIIVKENKEIQHDLFRKDLFDSESPEDIAREKENFTNLLCGQDIKRKDLLHDIELFKEADNFGSLLRPRLTVSSCEKILERINTHEKSLKKPTFVEQELIDSYRSALLHTMYLTQRYHVVIANPPYMGSKGMNTRLSAWAKEFYPDSKSDLFAMFIERGFDLTVEKGYSAMVTMQSWMFLSSFEKLREFILTEHTILSMAHLGARAFDSIGGEVVSTTAFILEKGHKNYYRGGFIRLVDGGSEAEKDTMLKTVVRALRDKS